MQRNKRVYELKGPVHFVGIGGCSMSGIAYILLKKGYKVQGSDIQKNDFTKNLISLGVEIHLSHSENNVKDAREVVYSNAVSADNPELILAKKRGLKIFTRGEMLAYLMNDSLGVAVCGTHGKTTTTSLIAFLLMRAGLDPTFIIGGDVEDLEGNAHLGKSDLFVAEADESDGSFLKLTPSFEVVTNIEREHLDHYKNFANIKNAFLRYIQSIKNDGWLLAGGDDKVLRDILHNNKEKIKAHVITYGTEPFNTVYAYDICSDNGMASFNVSFESKHIGKLAIPLLGIHNVKNTLAAVVLGLLNGVKWEDMVKIFPKFQGVKRRFQIKGEYKGALVIDDYAHHPTEIEAVLQSVRQLNPKRAIAVFQPHRYTRTKYFARDFAGVLKNVDIPILFPIYPASEKPIPGVTSELICDSLKEYGKQSLYFESQDELVDYLKKTVQADDIVLTIGAGNVYQIGEELIKS